MSDVQIDGLVSIPSKLTVDDLVAKITEILRAKGAKLFAVIDHSGEAAAAGLEMPPTKLLIFGNPKAGTPVMLASPSAAIDLPLKLLVSQDLQGQTSISFNSPAYLEKRHKISTDLLGNLSVVEGLARKAAGYA